MVAWLASSDGLNRISLANTGADGRELGRADVNPAAATVSRTHCVLFPTADDTFTVESRCTNVSGVRSGPGADWTWLRRGERASDVGTGWQLAFDRALTAETLFTFQGSSAPSPTLGGQGVWSWALESGWSPYSPELNSRLETAWTAGAASLLLDPERRAVFETMLQVKWLQHRAPLSQNGPRLRASA